ncbi:MAG: SPOR domain-containing protein, partial [Hyphomicrobium sp.]|nr:SPOR domain-containing protein [Hyphomicrobium sp.]
RAEPAESDIASEKQLRTGIRAYVTGDFKSAADSLSAALQGTLTSSQTASALLYRGLAYRKQGMPGRALSDLTRALQQANGLSDAERSNAEENRTLASQEAGLGSTESVAAPVVPLVTAEPPRKPAAPVIVSTAVPAPAESNWIESGSIMTSAAPPAPKPQSASPATVVKAAPAPVENNWVKTGSITTTVAPPAPKPEPATASWGDKVQVSMAPLPTAPPVPDAPLPQTSVAIAPAHPAPAPIAAAPISTAAVTPEPAPTPAATLAATPAAPKYLQIATLHSRSEAFALSVRLTSQYGGEFGRRRLQIRETQAENQEKAYRVRLGPYGNADEPQRVCTSLRAAGYECLVE